MEMKDEVSELKRQLEMLSGMVEKQTELINKLGGMVASLNGEVNLYNRVLVNLSKEVEVLRQASPTSH